MGKRYVARELPAVTHKPRSLLDGGMRLGGWVVMAASLSLCAFIYLAQRNASAVENAA
ncbi:MAG: hypothetical protein J7515_16445 [Caulobacter sp.]|nr:hypothetical protein [Caulobacter sp.]